MEQAWTAPESSVLLRSTAVEQAELVRSGEVSARELVESLLEAIERLDPEINAFVALCAERARGRLRPKRSRADTHRDPASLFAQAPADPVDENLGRQTELTFAGRLPADMVAFVLSIALALVSHTGHRQARASAHFPVRGVIVPGVSFAGIKLGDTGQRVRAVWGNNFTACGYCTDTTWLYEYRGGEPLGAAARFEKNKLVAVFSLGSPAGWKTDKGLYMGDPISNVYQYYGGTATTRCIGFDAITARIGKSVTAFYSAAGVVYGFAMVVPGMTVCQ